MRKNSFVAKFILAFLVVSLSACASSGVKHSENACAIFAEHNGFFNNWYRETRKAAMKYNIPMPIILATLRAESGFRATVHSKRKFILGLIPWGHISSAYGYAQALNNTWRHYQISTGHFNASRSSFADSVDFIGWYYRNSIIKCHLQENDAYNLYLTYVVGWSAFNKYGEGAASSAIKAAALRVERHSIIYDKQLRICAPTHSF